MDTGSIAATAAFDVAGAWARAAEAVHGAAAEAPADAAHANRGPGSADLGEAGNAADAPGAAHSAAAADDRHAAAAPEAHVIGWAGATHVGGPDAAAMTGASQAAQLLGHPDGLHMFGAPHAAPMAGATETAKISGAPEAPRVAGAPTDPAASVVAPTEPGARTAALQSVARTPPPSADPLRPPPGVPDVGLPTSTRHGHEFLIPGDQLVPATPIGLQVDPGAAWAWSRGGRDRPPARLRADAPERRPDREPTGDDDDAPPDAADAAAADEDRVAADAPDVLDGVGADDWCAPLTQALGRLLRAPDVPPALQVAATQWRRGRCIVLACPCGDDAAAAAWAFVLWPRRRAHAGGRPALYGLRVAARLTWARAPKAALWHHARAVKDHHPQRGRQLLVLDEGGAGAEAVICDPCRELPCEVQLGPVLARPLRRAAVCLRVDAVRKFWAALNAQWSVCVVVCSRPLLEGVQCPPAATMPSPAEGAGAPGSKSIQEAPC